MQPEKYPTQFILRPKKAAYLAGFSLPTFYRRRKHDPKFPKMVALGHNARATGVYQSDWLEYLRNFDDSSKGESYV